MQIWTWNESEKNLERVWKLWSESETNLKEKSKFNDFQSNLIEKSSSICKTKVLPWIFNKDLDQRLLKHLPAFCPARLSLKLVVYDKTHKKYLTYDFYSNEKKLKYKNVSL